MQLKRKHWCGNQDTNAQNASPMLVFCSGVLFASMRGAPVEPLLYQATDSTWRTLPLRQAQGERQEVWRGFSSSSHHPHHINSPTMCGNVQQLGGASL
jgi:hypothetical protein